MNKPQLNLLLDGTTALHTMMRETISLIALFQVKNWQISFLKPRKLILWVTAAQDIPRWLRRDHCTKSKWLIAPKSGLRWIRFSVKLMDWFQPPTGAKSNKKFTKKSKGLLIKLLICNCGNGHIASSKTLVCLPAKLTRFFWITLRHLNHLNPKDKKSLMILNRVLREY